MHPKGSTSFWMGFEVGTIKGTVQFEGLKHSPIVLFNT